MRIFGGRSFNEVAVPGDGNCLFYSLAHGLVGSEAAAPHIRDEVVDFVVADWEHLAPTTLKQGNVPYDSAEEYCM